MILFQYAMNTKDKNAAETRKYVVHGAIIDQSFTHTCAA